MCVCEKINRNMRYLINVEVLNDGPQVNLNKFYLLKCQYRLVVWGKVMVKWGAI